MAIWMVLCPALRVSLSYASEFVWQVLPGYDNGFKNLHKTSAFTVSSGIKFLLLVSQAELLHVSNVTSILIGRQQVDKSWCTGRHKNYWPVNSTRALNQFCGVKSWWHNGMCISNIVYHNFNNLYRLCIIISTICNVKTWFRCHRDEACFEFVY